MRVSRCAAKRRCGPGQSRREFLAGASVASASLLAGCFPVRPRPAIAKVRQHGPASRLVPTVRACFVRRKGEYGMWWPGQVYDGEAARAMYTDKLAATANAQGLKLDAWVAEAVAAKPDGLFVVLLDRQQHAWPTANKAIDTKIPTVVFSPVGSSFTTNTAAPSKKPGCFIASTDDFREAAYGLKMIGAAARLRATRCLVIKGRKRAERQMQDVGVGLRTIPAGEFLDLYKKTPETEEMHAMAADYIRRARRHRGATRQDVVNGVRSYVVARALLEREECDAITMDCLGALGRSKVSLPCIAWSKMNDEGVPAACEADLGAVASHTIVQYLFDRPGFQQDPVAETARQAIVGAHCCCATRLNGFDRPPSTARPSLSTSSTTTASATPRRGPSGASASA